MDPPKWSAETLKDEHGDDVGSMSSAISKMDFRKTVLSTIKGQALGQGDRSTTTSYSCHAAGAASVTAVRNRSRALLVLKWP